MEATGIEVALRLRVFGIIEPVRVMTGIEVALRLRLSVIIDRFR
jgi:hypothetical protein